MKSPTTIFFEQIDHKLDYFARKVCNRVFSEYRDVAWTHEQYNALQPLIRKELDELIWSTLKMFNNVGAELPDGVYGYRIQAQPYEKHDDGTVVDQEVTDIGDGYTDYCEMWRDYLAHKQ